MCSHLFFPTTALCSLCLDFPSLQGGHCWPGKAGQRVGLVPAVPLLSMLTIHKCYWSRSLAIPQHLSLCMSLFFGIFCHFQDLSCSQHLHHFLSRPSPPFFPRQSLLFMDPSFGMEPQASGFPYRNSLYAEAQHMIQPCNWGWCLIFLY